VGRGARGGVAGAVFLAPSPLLPFDSSALLVLSIGVQIVWNGLKSLVSVIQIHIA
jgi:hypothetical protein